LFENVKKKYDVIVANPPYIPSDQLKKCSNDVQKEPKIALDGGYDGLVLTRRLIDQSVKHLNKNGLILFEITGDSQDETSIELLLKKGFRKTFTLKDLAGFARVCGGYYE
jgi:release factor glutamine methyltransferase